MFYSITDFCKFAAQFLAAAAFCLLLPFVAMEVMEREDEPTAAERAAKESPDYIEERVRSAREADADRAGLYDQFPN